MLSYLEKQQQAEIFKLEDELSEKCKFLNEMGDRLLYLERLVEEKDENQVRMLGAKEDVISGKNAQIADLQQRLHNYQEVYFGKCSQALRLETEVKVLQDKLKKSDDALIRAHRETQTISPNSPTRAQLWARLNKAEKERDKALQTAKCAAEQRLYDGRHHIAVAGDVPVSVYRVAEKAYRAFKNKLAHVSIWGPDLDTVVDGQVSRVSQDSVFSSVEKWDVFLTRLLNK